MLAGGTDPLYRSVLAAGHKHFVRIEVWSGLGAPLAALIPTDRGGEPEGGLCFYGGAVNATLNSRVTRTLSVQVPFDLYPVLPTDLLAPFGNEIRAYRGVLLGDGSDVYTWQVFRGRIREVGQTSSGAVAVMCSDRAADVVDHQFVNPQNSQPANTVFQEWMRLIGDAVPDASFGVSDSFSATVKPLTWELGRSAALDEMAKSVSALWYAQANGDFVLRVLPWTQSTPVVLTLTDAVGGTVNEWAVSRSRDSIYNVVTVSGERLNGDAPVYATASDTMVGSPTNVSGGFGVRSLLERLQTPSTSGGAQGAANSILATSIAPVESWQLQMMPDAALELGDVVRVQVNNRDVTQVVTGLTIPLDLSSDMMVSTRSLVLNRLQGSAS